MNNLNDLFTIIEKNHISEPCINSSEIDKLERKYEYKLPRDLIEFYRRFKTVRLFCSENGSLYRFVPANEIHPTRIDIYGNDINEFGPSTWLTVCDVQDGNYIAIDIGSKEGEKCNYIDCFHETFSIPGESTIIALSFTELLEKALAGGNENVYFLQNGFIGYGDGRPLTVENATLRIGNPEAPKKGWIVRFNSNGNSHHKFFSDNDYGGKKESYLASKKYIELNSK